jgi:2-hydroxychromene-2-carboxylate isomerase
MPNPSFDFFVEFASTYSYPAAMRIGPLAAAAGVAVRWRPFLLGPIFKAQGLATSPFDIYPVKGRYMWRDVERLCDDLGLAFHPPEPFPQPSLLAARVAHVGLLAEGWGEDFCRAVFHAEFAERRQIGEENVIRDLLAALGVAADDVLRVAQSDAVKAKLRADTEEAERCGVFGAPSFVTADGELFWGNDRLEQALAWASRGDSNSRSREAAIRNP